MARKLQIIGNLLGEKIDPAELKQMVEDYLEENPPIPQITINGKEPDENGNFVIEVQPGSSSTTSDQVVKF